MLYCVLCGFPITRSFPSQKWLQETRAVWIEDDDWDNVKLSGVGICDEFNDISTCSFPVDPLKRYDDSNGPNSMIDISLQSSEIESLVYPGTTRFEHEPVWGWGFHASCWDILNQGFKPNLCHLFDACLTTPLTLQDILDWGHTYGGAAVVRLTRFLPTLVTRFPDLDQVPQDFISDPFHIPGLTKAITNSFRLQTDAFQSELSLDPECQTRDPFTRLSPEILQLIIILLPTCDVRSLRLASPVFATLGLPESFWASRFQDGKEFDCVPEVFEKPPESWRALYLSLKTWTSQNSHMSNRRRIWTLSKTLQQMLRQMERTRCHGSPIKTWYEPSVVDTSHKDEREPSWRTASRGVHGPKDKFTRGCRVLRARTLRFPKALRFQSIHVSFAHTGSGVFVSGLLFVDQSDGQHALGYIHENQSVAIELPVAESIQGWEVALDMRGIRAIAAVSVDGITSPWAGEPGDFPRWYLAEAGGVSSIKAEFDALKMVSLSRDSAREPHNQGEWRNNCLWYPDLPPERMLYQGSSGEESPSDYVDGLPVCTVFFGGSDGRDLSGLIEIVIWVFDTAYIAGIKFIYTDSSRNRHLGRLGPFSDASVPRLSPNSEDHRISLTIDGPGGEKISAVEVGSKSGQIIGLKIQTNFNQQVITPPHPFAGDGHKWMAMQPTGSEIVGMFCRRAYTFIDFGLILNT